MIERDAEIHFEAVERGELSPLVAVLDADLATDADEAFRRVLLFNARRLQQKHEWTGASVHDRDLRSGKVDDHVVDAEPGEGRHQMLNRRHLDAVLHERGAEHRFAHELRIGRNVHRPVEIDAAEHDARVLGRRAQGHVDLLPRVQPDAGGAYRRLQSALSQH
jgi:hypothetical protein